MNKKISKVELERAKKLLTENGVVFSEVHEDSIEGAIDLMKSKDDFEMTMTLDREMLDKQSEDEVEKEVIAGLKAIEAYGCSVLSFYKKLKELNFKLKT